MVVSGRGTRFGGLNGIWVRRLTVGQPSSEGVGFCSFCVISHGWLGTAAIGALPSDPQRGVPSRICTMASPAEAPKSRAPSSTLRYRGGKIGVRVVCAGAQACRGTLRIKKGSTTIGCARIASRRRPGTVTIKPSRRGARALGSRRTQTVSVQLKPSTGEVVTRALKLRR